jgi:predicted alpha/beta-hydrolase family hydrolase
MKSPHSDPNMPKRKRPSKDQKSKDNDEPGDEDHSPSASDLPTSESFTISPSDNNKKEISCLLHSPPSPSSPNNPQQPLIFTHGVGGTITSPAMHDFASGYSAVLPLLYFQGTTNLISRVKAFSTVRTHQQGSDGFAGLGGRSMGARAAVIAALEEGFPEGENGKLVLVSYPLTAGKDGGTREFERREKILLDLPETVEVLFVIGSRDAQCDLGLLEDVRGRIKVRSWLCVVVGADHGMECRPKSCTKEMRRVSGKVAAEWMEEREEGRRYCEVKVGESGNVVCEGWMEEKSPGVVDAMEDG